MLLQRIHIENLRSIAELDWRFDPGREAGWHVILGNNGSGKSSVLRALAATLMGVEHSNMLRQDVESWIRRGQESLDVFAKTTERSPHELEFRVYKLGHPALLGRAGTSRAKFEALFSCGFGPYRHFGESGYETQSSSVDSAILARHLNLFNEHIVLRDCLDWLQDLQFRRLEAREAGDASGGDAGLLLERLKAFIAANELLPFGVQLRSITADAVTFEDGQGIELPVEELSDGYHSLLSIIFELVRRLAEHYGAAEIWSEDEPRRVTAEGVVLVDEIDAHLHPSWQREIGWTLTRCFPKLQFIVTTHSPLICQAAEHGTLLRLPDPGEEAAPRVVEGLERERLIYGNVLDAYATPSFGRVPTRSDAGRERLERLAELNQKSLRQGLDDAELDEREHLLRVLPTARDDSSDAAQ